MGGLTRIYSRAAALLVLGMVLLLLDFFSKIYFYSLCPFYDSFQAIPVFHNLLGIDFSIQLTLNRGAAWGFFANFQYLLVALRILMIFALFLYLFFFTKRRAYHIPLVLILTGAIGNIVDFFLYGFVIDFLHFRFWGYDFPVFNVADSLITIGVVWMIGLTLFSPKKKTSHS